MNTIGESRRGRAPRNPKILDICVNDPVVLEELGTRETLEARREYGEELLELGARVARTHRHVSEAHQVNQVFEEQARRAEERDRASRERLEDHVQTTRSSLALMKTRMRSEMSTLVATVNRDTEAQQRAIALLHERTERALKTLLDGVENGVERASGDSEKLVVMFKERLQSTLKELDAQVKRAEQVIASGLERESSLLERRELREQASSRKGTDFEVLVTQDLAEFGRARGDVVERVGATPCPGTTTKKGDVFYQMSVGDRLVPIVLECKDKELKPGGADPFFLRSLETAMRERGGEFGIVVSTIHQNTRDGRHKFPVLQFAGDDKFVVLIDRDEDQHVALETALHLIHRVVSQKKLKDGAAEIDMAEVGQAVQRISETHSRFRTLKASCTSLGTQVARMRDQLDSMEESLDNETDHLKSLLGLAA